MTPQPADGMSQPLDLDKPAEVEDGFAPGGPAVDRSQGSRPELRLADRLAQNLDVPVDIDALLREYADVIPVEMPISLDVDAVLIGLDGSLNRPRVIVNARRDPFGPRRRFTLAHELAHILLPWHVGTIGCLTDPGFGQMGLWTAQLEAEANRFAARLLVPQRWLQDSVVLAATPSEMFATLDNAQVSVLPALLRLVPELPYGWMIATGRGKAEGRVFRSPGSFMPLPPMDTAQPFDVRADDTGLANLAGRSVEWWRWLPEVPPDPELPAIGPRVRRPIAEVRRDQLREAATQLLRAALEKHGMGDEMLPHFAGVTGAVNGSVRIRTAPAIDCALRQRFSSPSAEGAVVTEREFRSYLAARAWQWSADI